MDFISVILTQTGEGMEEKTLPHCRESTAGWRSERCCATFEAMGFKARVKNGRIVMDEPTDLPDGTVLHLLLDEDDLDEEEWAALELSFERGLTQANENKTRPAEEIVAWLQRK